MIYRVIWTYVGGRRVRIYEGPEKAKASLAFREGAKCRDVKKVLCIPGKRRGL